MASSDARPSHAGTGARVALSLCGLLGLCDPAPPAARAWTLIYDPPRKVNGDTFGLKINYQNCPATFDSIVDEALRIWNSVPTAYLKLEKQGATGSTPAQIMAGTNGDFAIACDANYGATTSSDPNQTLAVAISTFDATGDIVRGGVIVNVQTQVFLTETLNQQIFVLTHETGHVLGLGHTSDPNAIMYFQVRNGTSRPTIGLDDIDGMTFLYPRNELKSSAGNLFGCGTVSQPTDRGPPGGGLAAFCSSFVLLWLACQALKRRSTTGSAT